MERDDAEFRADLSWANLGGAELLRADMSHTNLIRVDLDGADLTDAYLGITNEELERRAKSLKGTIMPNGQKYEDWLKSKGRAEDG